MIKMVNCFQRKKKLRVNYKGHEAIIAVGTMKVEQVPETTPETTPNTEPTQPETTIEPSETTAQ